MTLKAKKFIFFFIALFVLAIIFFIAYKSTHTRELYVTKETNMREFFALNKDTRKVKVSYFNYLKSKEETCICDLFVTNYSKYPTKYGDVIYLEYVVKKSEEVDTNVNPIRGAESFPKNYEIFIDEPSTAGDRYLIYSSKSNNPSEIATSNANNISAGGDYVWFWDTGYEGSSFKVFDINKKIDITKSLNFSSYGLSEGPVYFELIGSGKYFVTVESDNEESNNLFLTPVSNLSKKTKISKNTKNETVWSEAVPNYVFVNGDELQYAVISFQKGQYGQPVLDLSTIKFYSYNIKFGTTKQINKYEI